MDLESLNAVWIIFFAKMYFSIIVCKLIDFCICLTLSCWHSRFYETNLSTGKTRVCQVPEAKLVTGIATDPSGIILVGSMKRFRSDVLLFDQNLNFLVSLFNFHSNTVPLTPRNQFKRTLDLEVNLASISSITFLNRELYLTDVKEGVVYVSHLNNTISLNC